MNLYQTLVLLAVVLPLASAGVVACLGPFARRAAVLLAILHLAVTAGVVIGMVEQSRSPAASARPQRTFQPLFVPGDPGLPGSTGEPANRTSWTLLDLSRSSVPADRPGPRIQFFIGIDGFNVWLLALCSVMLLPAIAVSYSSVRDRPAGYYAWLFVLQGGAVGAFLSFDVLLFYVFFELTLIPAFFLIGGWGSGSGRRDAARKFFLYTLAGSLLSLVGLLGVVLTNPDPQTKQFTFALPDLVTNVQAGLQAAYDAHQAGNPQDLIAKHALQFWLFAALIAGFMVKVPVWPFHTWQPTAYAEAPIGTTILLSALLAKLGTFGLLRFVLPLTPDAAVQYGLPAVGTMAAIGIIYGAFCAYGQRDLKLMLAYGSLSHLGFLVLGIFAFNAEGISGASLHMINHGVATGGLFAMVAFLLDRYRTTDMRQFGGLIEKYPTFSFLAFVLCLASIGLPGLNGFPGEMLMLGGLFDARNPGIHKLGLAVVAAFGILLAAWYMLTMMQRVFFNPLKEPPGTGGAGTTDITGTELTSLGMLAALCLALGLFPQLLLAPMARDAAVVGRIGDDARARVLACPNK